MTEIEEILTVALRELEAIADPKALEAWRVKYLGRKGALTEVLRGLGKLSLEERKVIGAMANEAKAALEERYNAVQVSLLSNAEAVKTAAAGFDVTLPGYPLPAGHKHVLTQAIEEVSYIFHSMGFGSPWVRTSNGTTTTSKL